MAPQSKLQQPSPEEEQQNHNPISAQLLKAAAQASHDSSGESGVEDDASPDDPGQPSRRKKRSRACQACRSMKIRCEPVEGQEACKSCAKVNRECIMPGPARKRQKTVHKVAELEKKIDALTQSLMARKQSISTPPQDSPAVTDVTRSSASGPHPPPPPVEKEFNYGSVLERPQHEENFFQSSQPGRMNGAQESTSDYVDVLDRGLLSLETASSMFELFVTEMNPLCPMVAFPDGLSVASVRRQRPMVFLSTLCATCGVFAPALQADLQVELAREIANRVLYRSEKSLDLIHAMMISSNWLGRHRDSKDLAFNQYLHSSLVMALDLGLGKRLRTPLAKDALEDAELRRTWLACYYNAATVATSMRHPSLVRTTTYVEECLEVLSTSPVASPYDLRLCGLVRVIQIMEDVSQCFHMDDPASSVRLEDSATQYQLRLFERRLADWKSSMGRHFHPLVLEHIDAVVSLYIHEIALHDEHNIDDFKITERILDKPVATSKNFITTAHLDSLTTCVCDMKRVIESFIATCANVSKLLPCLHVVWTSYAVVAMIRLHGSLQAPGSKYAEVFMPDLKVDEYLDAIIQQLSEISASYSPIPFFVQAFQKLKVWHKHRTAGAGMVEAHEDYKTNTSRMMKTVRVADESGNMDQQQQQRRRQSHSMNNDVAGRPMSANTARDAQLQGIDSGLLAGNLPIDAAMFDNQDWNFTLEDWNNFDASMNEPTGSAWIGYLM